MKSRTAVRSNAQPVPTNPNNQYITLTRTNTTTAYTPSRNRNDLESPLASAIYESGSFKALIYKANTVTCVIVNTALNLLLNSNGNTTGSAMIKAVSMGEINTSETSTCLFTTLFCPTLSSCPTADNRGK